MPTSKCRFLFGKSLQQIIKKIAKEDALKKSDSLDLRPDLYAIDTNRIQWARRVSKNRPWKKALMRFYITHKPIQIHYSKRGTFLHYGWKVKGI